MYLYLDEERKKDGEKKISDRLDPLITGNVNKRYLCGTSTARNISSAIKAGESLIEWKCN